MAVAAEKFRREMDAMRDELTGPKVDPVSRRRRRMGLRRVVTDVVLANWLGGDEKRLGCI
jgi:hypothetical protein